MFKLISNENMKIFRRSRTWIMMGLLVLAILLMAILILSHQNAGDPNWKQGLLNQIAQWQQRIHNGHGDAQEIAQLQARIQMNQYYIAHNINPNITTGWSFVISAQKIFTLLIAFILVVAGDIVASEFSTGSVKMLLTQTATRSKILLSKYISMMNYSLMATVLMFVASVLVGWIFFGTQGMNAPYIYMDAHQTIQQISTLSYLLMQYGFLLVQILFAATIAFMISAIFRSSALAITISLLSYLVGSTVANALSSYSFAKYILFANTDLSQYVVRGPQIPGLTLSFSITILVVYFIVMNVLAWLFFVKRDVAYS